MRFLVLFLIFVATSGEVHAQLFDVYADTTVTDFYITITPERLDSVLNGDVTSDVERLAKVKIVQNGKADSVDNAGFRLRGNTSRESKKKSFKVSINTFTKGQRLLGYKDFNLNGEHNDPAVVRSKVVWDMFTAAGLPATRVAHVRLFINGAFAGIYANIEHINDDFLQRRFGNQSGNLYKCLYPADLTFRNSNPDSYKFLRNTTERTYELKTNEETDDYTDLAGFIDFINNTSTAQFEGEIESRFNVDGFLRYLAVGVLTGNWDNYWYLKNNFYLYNNPASGRFEFLPYDVDNTLGVDWVGQNWTTRNIYSWGNSSNNEYRPLATRILAIQKYKDRYSWYLSTMKTTISTEAMVTESAVKAQTLIQPYIADDPYYPQDYGYTSQTFANSLTQAAGGHVKYGVVPFVTARNASINQQLVIGTVVPFVKEIVIPTIFANRSARISVTTGGDQPVDSILVRIISGSTNSSFKALKTAENTFQIDLPPQSTSFKIHLELKDATAKKGYWPSVSTLYAKTISVLEVSTLYPIRLNEFLADNGAGLTDEAGDREDWVEIVNPSGEAVSLAGYSLTDNFSIPGKWMFPDRTLSAGGFQVIFADEEASEGDFHAAFKLSKGGEQLGLFYKKDGAFVLVDSIKFSAQQTDISFARSPDATGKWYFSNPATPGLSNGMLTANENEIDKKLFLLSSYPNPFNGRTQIRFELPASGFATITVIDLTGRTIQSFGNVYYSAGSHSLSLDASRLATGVYIVRLQTGSGVLSRKISLIR